MMKKTDILTWALTIHLIIIGVNLLKYTGNLVMSYWLIFNALFNFWFYHNIRKKEYADIVSADKYDKAQGQWGELNGNMGR